MSDVKAATSRRVALAISPVAVSGGVVRVLFPKMKPLYVICAVLGLTIGSLLFTANGAPLEPTAANNNPVASANSTAAVVPAPVTVTGAKNDSDTPKVTTVDSTTTAVPENSSITDKTTPKATTVSTTTTTATTKPTTKSPDITTAVPTNATTTSTTTPTTSTTTTLAPVTSPSTTAAPTAAAVTTALPPSTASPSKDRHFDGLSFFGGIILATCLMAVAAFSWKFYRQCNERNYRTL
ncbi:Sialomucin core protein [Ooceraea biroi]|uniref:Sialomucin core protein n=2 Tax=Ooceraea biroi TaxID=2015173 RepID=A0A026WP59_OOCBI|nr:Sialomucin core protein [Ooceraea biroi]